MVEAGQHHQGDLPVAVADQPATGGEGVGHVDVEVGVAVEDEGRHPHVVEGGGAGPVQVLAEPHQAEGLGEALGRQLHLVGTGTGGGDEVLHAEAADHVVGAVGHQPPPLLVGESRPIRRDPAPVAADEVVDGLVQGGQQPHRGNSRRPLPATRHALYAPALWPATATRAGSMPGWAASASSTARLSDRSVS